MPPEKTTSDESAAREPRWFWVMFFALTIFVYFFGLSIPLLGPDEPRYAQVAREMFDRGDWITPTLGGFNWFEKPALLYWFEISAYHIFGVTEFAARVGSAICGLGTIACLWLIGRFALNDKRAANWLAMLAASTIGIIVFSRGASFDIVVTFPITASLTGFIIYELNENKPRLALFSFYFFIGVALLAKGLIGILFPIAIVGLFYVFLRRFPGRDLIHSVFWGVPLLIIVASVWYLPMYLRHGNTFIDEFIIRQHFQRFTSNKYQHPQPFYFFLWVLPLMTLPWMPFLIAGIGHFFLGLIPAKQKVGFNAERRQRFVQNPKNRLEFFSFAWLLVPLVFFSFSGSKLPGYILPAVPAAIVLSLGPAVRYAQKTFIAKGIRAIAVSTFVSVVAAIIFIVPSFARTETDKWLFETANAEGYSRLQVAGLFTLSHNAEFYAAGRLIRDADGKQHKFYGVHEIRDYITTHDQKPLLVLIPNEYVKQLTGNDLVDAEVLEENGELAIAFVAAK
jgi:4-amino-4-deoxy-L-arabinose transferase-like glycosyltransferase